MDWNRRRRLASLTRLTAGILLTVPCAGGGGTLAAQQWNDARTLDLVRRATARRAEQLADSGLVDYQATAHGYLTFLAQLGQGFREPPRVVKADELALQVYWHAPNLSKQWIVGRRDTTVLPTDIEYHRDHLGIVQGNFPAIIRLGEGDEVQDVPHPLSPAGLADYDFSISDSLRISIPGRAIEVYEVKVRPKDDRSPRIIGALYLDRDNGQVVRMAFSFTRAAFLDRQLEDVFIVLENGLVGTRYWLPRHQEVEIRRTATWLDYPVRGIIRGRWEIGDYQLNAGIPRAQFAGPEIAIAPTGLLRSYPWSSARILDSLPPEVRAATAEEVRRVQAEVRALVRDEALRRSRGSALAGAGVSDFLRFDKVEGVSLGLGIRGRFGGGGSAFGAARYGTADHEIKGTAVLGWQNARGRSAQLAAGSDLRDIGDVAERSGIVNSLAAQEAGSDYTDLVRVRRLAASIGTTLGATGWTLEVARERQEPAAIHATPGAGRFIAAFPADTLDGWRGRIIAERPTALWLGGLEMRSRLEAGVLRTLPGSTTGGSTVWRGSADVEVQRELKSETVRLVARTIAAGVAGNGPIPRQSAVYLGGPVSGPGYEYHSLVGNAALSQRIELRFPVPFMPISLGRFGRSPASLTAAPFVTAVALRSLDLGRPAFLGSGATRVQRRVSGVYPAAGVGALLFFDLLRLDVARGLRDGRWSFYLDVNRPFWSVL